MRLVTYNLFNGAAGSYNRLVELVRSANADVLCLQEVNGWQEDGDRLLESFTDQALFAAYTYGNSNTEYKLATFSKHTILSQDVHVAGFWHCVVETRTMFDDQEITIYNVHLDPWKEENRLREVERLLGLLDAAKMVIITGDFNSLSRRDNYGEPFVQDLRSHGITKYGENQLEFRVTDRLEAAGFVDVAARLNARQYTVPSPFNQDVDHEAPARIDYVFASPALAAKATEINVLKNDLSDTISDHYPLCVSFDFTVQPSQVVQEMPQVAPPAEPKPAPTHIATDPESDEPIPLPLA